MPAGSSLAINVAASRGRVALVRIDAQRRATGDDALDQRQHPRIVVDIEADLDLDGAIAVGAAGARSCRACPLRRRLAAGRGSARARARAARAADARSPCRAPCETPSRRTARARRAPAAARKRRVRVVPGNSRRELARQRVAVADRLVGVAGQQRRLAEAALALVTGDLDDDRVVARDGAERQPVRSRQRNLEPPHVDALDPHDAALGGAGAARRRMRNRRYSGYSSATAVSAMTTALTGRVKNTVQSLR